MNKSQPSLNRLLHWMIDNPVATNLLTLAILIFGLVSFGAIQQQTSPSFKINEIEISASYPGATAQDMEQSIVLAIEQLLINHSYVDELSAQIEEGDASVTLALHDWVNRESALNEIKNTLDRVTTFPKDMEPIVVSLVKEEDSLIEIGLSGDVSPLILYQHAQRLKNVIASELDVAKVLIEGQGSAEIIIEVKEAILRQYDISLEDISNALSSNLTDVPVGNVATQGGDIVIRTLGRANSLDDFANISVINHNNQSVLLGELANLNYEFGEHVKPFSINSQPGIALIVYQDALAKPIELSAEIIEFIDEYQVNIPKELTLTVLQDEAEDYQKRVALLTENGLIGMLLIMLVLAMFVDVRLAFWVSMSIPVAIIGALGLMPMLALPINMITLFAFIITLGILVDDSVVVAENIHQKVLTGIEIKTALKEGVGEMALPIVISVITNMIAFLPVLFVPGELGVMFKPMTLLIFAIFFVSLVEALFILPHHLSGLKPKVSQTFIMRMQQKSVNSFNLLKSRYYAALLKRAMAQPTVVIALFIAMTSIVFSWTLSDRVGQSFVPKIESTRIDAEIEFPSGLPYQQKAEIVNYVQDAGYKALESINGIEGHKYVMQDLIAAEASVTFRLVSDDMRDFSALEFVDAWREKIGPVAGVKSIFFDYQVGPGGGQEIVVELGHQDSDVLAKANVQMMKSLSRVSGVADVDSALVDGKPQLDLTVNQLGKSLGFDSDSLGRSVRSIFYGDTLHRQIINGDEVKVKLRMDKAVRPLASHIEDLIITAPNGQEVPLGQVANINHTLATTAIDRLDGQQFVEITGSILRQTANATAVMNRIELDLIPALGDQFDGLSVELGGSARAESKVNMPLIYGTLISLALIYAILAVYFKSYLAPLLVIAVIPFCLSAALLGHILLGADLSVMSLFGMIALAGLVINGAFVMLVQINLAVKRGEDMNSAIEQAALSRFRPVIITAVTTAVGLFPLLFETSTQALYLIPMAISLSFGTIFSIATILLLSPALFVVAKKQQIKQDIAPNLTLENS
ncbi:MAG: efflux RND transporter permease subunit [Psychrobium sp.]